jgi:hypothetical protein
MNKPTPKHAQPTLINTRRFTLPIRLPTSGASNPEITNVKAAAPPITDGSLIFKSVSNGLKNTGKPPMDSPFVIIIASVETATIHQP